LIEQKIFLGGGHPSSFHKEVISVHHQTVLFIPWKIKKAKVQ